MKPSNGNIQEIASVKKAMRILRSFSMDEPEKKISELSASLNMNKSTVSRLMSTLANEGFVTKDEETQKYRLGYSVLSLSGIITSNLEINREAAPVLSQLTKETGETSHLVVLEGINIVYLDKIECKHPVRIFTHLGRSNPAYCTSSGKAILAHREPELVERVIENGLERYASNTITDSKELYRHLEQVKKQGFDYSVNEFHEGVSSVAAPIRDYSGKVYYAVSVVGPIQRIHQHNMQEIAKKVMKAGDEISKRMGYRA